MRYGRSMGIKDEEPGHVNPSKRYWISIRSQKNFMKSLFMKSFFGKYRNTYLGFLWNFASPLIYLVLLYLVSTEIRGRDADFIIMLASGIFVYHILLGGITGGTSCFTGGASMIKKMGFPREILVYVSAAIHLVVSLICYVILFVMIVALGHGFNLVALAWFPVMLILALLFSIGCSLVLSSLTVYVRDIQYALGSITIIFFVMTPLRDSVYNISGVRGELMWYNPFTYFMEPMHQIFYYNSVPELWMVGYAIVFTVLVLLIGALVFNKLKHGFVERL